MSESVIEDMLQQGVIQSLTAAELDSFLDGERLRLLFFSGPQSQHREAHDVAVALRELLKDYGSELQAGVISQEDEAALQERFRVLVLPSLVFVMAGEALEVLPGVKDWGVYTAAFQRYLGAPQTVTKLMEGRA